MQNTVVVKYGDGRLVKGTTHDFLPNKKTFHVTETDPGQRIPENPSGLKAVFFVKTYDGSREYREKIDGRRVGMGRKIQVQPPPSPSSSRRNPGPVPDFPDQGGSLESSTRPSASLQAPGRSFAMRTGGWGG